MQKYNCKVCGGELYWDADMGALLCEYCDATYKVSDFEDLTKNSFKNVDELKNGDVTQEMVVYQCSHCGAELVTSNKTMATTCAYCGRAISITEKSVDNFRPKKIIPFSIDKSKAISLYKDYINKSPIAPEEFLKEAVIEKMQGLYVPYWLYSMGAKSKISFEGEKKSTKRVGDYKVTTHNIYNVIVRSEGDFLFVPVDASIKLDDKLMDTLDPYSIEKFVDYNPAYMAGFFAEQFDENKEATVERGKEKIINAIQKLSRAEVNEYSNIKLSDHESVFKDEVVDYGMLPVWLLNIDFKNQKYTYAINGETGKVVGQIPISQSRLLKRNLKKVGIWYLIVLVLAVINVFTGFNPILLLFLFL